MEKGVEIYFFDGLGNGFTGIILKLFFTGRFKVVSTAMYVLMGWLIIFISKILLLIYMKRSILPNSWWSFYIPLVPFYTALKKENKIQSMLFSIFCFGREFCHFIYLFIRLAKEIVNLILLFCLSDS